jgi:hypothetical protein
VPSGGRRLRAPALAGIGCICAGSRLRCALSVLPLHLLRAAALPNLSGVQHGARFLYSFSGRRVGDVVEEPHDVASSMVAVGVGPVVLRQISVAMSPETVYRTAAWRQGECPVTLFRKSARTRCNDCASIANHFITWELKYMI